VIDRYTTRATDGQRAVGADGCRGGWVVVTLDGGRVHEVEVVAALGPALEVRRPRAVGIDMPIGLTDGPVRAADRAARAQLGRRASSVFSAPPRAVIDAYVAGEVTTHAAATALAVATTGRGMSIQAWGLVPKVAEVDALIAGGSEAAEVHPEVAFAVLAGRPLPRKTSWAGLERRRELLRAHGIDLPVTFAGADRCAPDDVLDAAVCAYVAGGLAAADGSIRTLPEPATEHDRGRPIVVTIRRPPGRLGEVG
jgi:predicted RNase H-like nuclease